MNEKLFGTARFAELRDLEIAGFKIANQPLPDAPILGKVINWKGQHPFEHCLQNGAPLGIDSNSAYLQMHVEGHIMTVAPTRSGKGVGSIIPNLLNILHNILIFDPKAENYTLTSQYRRDILNQHIWCFDPYREVQYRTGQSVVTAKYATLARIKRLYDCIGTAKEERGYELMAEAARIAEAIILRPKNEKDPFFNAAAQAMIKAAIILTCFRYENYKCPPISKIRDLLLGEDGVQHLKSEIEDKMIQSSGRLSCKYNLLLKTIDEYEAYAGNRDVRATVAMQTEFLEDPGVARMLDADYNYGVPDIFDPQMLRQQNGHSVYIVIPPRHLSRQVRAVRLMLSGMLDEIMRGNPCHGAQPNRTLFLLDEIGQFGPLDPLRKAVTLGAAYGAILWMFWQDIAQLKNVYPDDWGSFLSNSSVQQFFGCNDMETAGMISKRCGVKYAQNTIQNTGIASHGIFSDINQQLTQMGMPIELIRPYEVIRANPEIIFTFKQGTFPILVRRISYYNDRVFQQRVQDSKRHR